MRNQVREKKSIDCYTNEELLRNQLATKSNFKELEKTYVKKLKRSNPNTNRFWNSKIITSGSHSDVVTKRRIEAVYNMIPSKTKKMLDIGIGYGYLEEVLLKKNRMLDITGIDLSEEAINRLRKKYKLRLFITNIENFPKHMGKFDLVVAMEIFEHIFPHKIMGVLKKIKSVLNNEGTIIVSVPMLMNNPKTISTFPYDSSNHVRLYTKELIIGELQIAGYVVKEVKEIYAYPNFYNFRYLINFVLKRWKPNIIVIKAQIK